MSNASAHLHGAQQQVRQVAQEVGPFIEHFARFGYAAKGVVYCIVGALAAVAAAGAGGQTAGSRGALEMLSHQPFGQVLLGIVALGLVGYSLWQFIRAIEDPEGEGDDAKAIAKRIGFFISGVIHFLLVIYALNIITGAGAGAGNGGGGDDQGAQSMSGKAMSYPLGGWAVAAAGAGVVGYGLFQLFRAFHAKLDKQLRLYAIRDEARRAVINVSRFGIAARGVVFGIIGVFLMLAAYHQNANEAKGVAGALRALEQQPYGPWLLAIVGMGLIAYGLYEFIRARYRQIKPT